MEIKVRPGVVSGVTSVLDALTERVRCLEEELHSRDMARLLEERMSMESEAMDLLKAINPIAAKEWYTENLQKVSTWLLQHDSKVLFMDVGDSDE